MALEGTLKAPFFSEKRRLQAAQEIIRHVAGKLNAHFSIRLWDGTLVPLGDEVLPDYYISINSPVVPGSLLRRPTLGNVMEHYACGNIDFHGGDLYSFVQVANAKRPKKWSKKLSKNLILRKALPLFCGPSQSSGVSHKYAKEETGRRERARSNKDFVQFHYDLSNEFYALFLDSRMQYSCAYFKDWQNSLEQAQLDKLDMICRKLRLRPGEKLLDIGCGWGGLICHAAKNYGVKAHGVTLSQKQYEYAQNKVRQLGLEESVSVELKDYIALEGEYDKIASIGMFEHVGIANFSKYFRKLGSLLRDRGILLNHGIARRAKASGRKFRKIKASNRWILRHIFPGTELDHIGHTLETMENCGFEVQDVEAWRGHYARTCRHWAERLAQNSTKAIECVGRERYRLWLAYLVSVSISFTEGPLRIYQTVATKHASKGLSGLPSTRNDLYI